MDGWPLSRPSLAILAGERDRVQSQGREDSFYSAAAHRRGPHATQTVAVAQQNFLKSEMKTNQCHNADGKWGGSWGLEWGAGNRKCCVMSCLAVVS